MNLIAPTMDAAFIEKQRRHLVELRAALLESMQNDEAERRVSSGGRLSGSVRCRTDQYPAGRSARASRLYDLCHVVRRCGSEEFSDPFLTGDAGRSRSAAIY